MRLRGAGSSRRRTGLLLAALLTTVWSCESGTAPGADEPHLLQARYGAADPPPAGQDFAVQVATRTGAIDADVLLRADVACNTVGAGLESGDTLLLVIETTAGSGCQPVAGGTLVEAVIIGIPEDPPPFRIEWWHGSVVDTVFGAAVE